MYLVYLKCKWTKPRFMGYDGGKLEIHFGLYKIQILLI